MRAKMCKEQLLRWKKMFTNPFKTKDILSEIIILQQKSGISHEVGSQVHKGQTLFISDSPLE
jgi:hypothetical protein